MRRARIQSCDRLEEAAAIISTRADEHGRRAKCSLPADGFAASEHRSRIGRAARGFAGPRRRWPSRAGETSYLCCMRPPAGRFRVRRVSGLLPPFGVTKRIDGSRGMTYLFGVPVGAFRVIGRRFVYKWWPIVDELDGED